MSTEEAEDAGTPKVETVSSYEGDAMEQMRIAAQARRQRILDNANARMGLVEGTGGGGVEETSSNTNSNTDAAPNAEISEAKSTATTASKLAAMRRRRFKSTPAATVVATATTADEPTVAIDLEEIIAVESEKQDTALGGKKEDGVENVLPVEETMLVPPVIVAAAADTDAAIEAPSSAKNDDTNNNSNNAAATKYMGVAKMRRRMLQERQQQKTTLEVASNNNNNSNASTTHKQSINKKQKSNIATILPILMNVFTLLLLVGAGLDVGLQQGAVEYHYCQNNNNDDESNQYCLLNNAGGAAEKDSPSSRYNNNNALTVHSELAPRKMGGLQRTLSLILPFAATQSSTTNNNNEPVVVVKPQLLVHRDDKEEWQARMAEHETDEFSDDRLVRGGDAKDKDNLVVDPLFQVDLDQFTKGDGLYFTLVRFAVYMHRCNLSIFYYTPRSMFQSILLFVLSLLKSPPVLCLAAIVLRQCVGKFILGANNLPRSGDAGKNNTNNNSNSPEKSKLDIMSTIQTFVTTAVLAKFPTLVTLYDIWTHLRADMYVILFGVFVGLAWSHNNMAGSMYGMTSSSSSSSRNMDDANIQDSSGIEDEL